MSEIVRRAAAQHDRAYRRAMLTALAWDILAMLDSTGERIYTMSTCQGISGVAFLMQPASELTNRTKFVRPAPALRCVTPDVLADSQAYAF